MSEKAVLARLKKQAKAHGLRFVRLSLRPGVEAGWPDVIVLGPNRQIVFIETKAPGKPLKPIQEERAREIGSFGHLYHKVDSVEDADVAMKNFMIWCRLCRKSQ